MRSMRVVSLLIVSILITGGSALAKTYYLVSEAPLESRVVVVERSYFLPVERKCCCPCGDRIACIKEDTFITEARANALAREIARCCLSTICFPKRISCSRFCSSVTKVVETNPCSKRMNRKFNQLNNEIELLKRQVRYLEKDVY